MAYARQLTVEDAPEYYHVLHRSYQMDRPYPISFSAMDATLEDEKKWLAETPTYGWFENDRLISAISWVEEEVLKKQLKAPFVTLGTANTHPWLKDMYLHLGFHIIGEKQLPGKKHKTIFLQKEL